MLTNCFPVLDYMEKNIGAKVVTIIQSYLSVVDGMV